MRRMLVLVSQARCRRAHRVLRTDPGAIGIVACTGCAGVGNCTRWALAVVVTSNTNAMPASAMKGVNRFNGLSDSDEATSEMSSRQCAEACAGVA